MKDDFDGTAKKEIDESLSAMEKIDSESKEFLSSNELEQISKYLHEIKGLAPMIDQANVNSIATLLHKVIEIQKEKQEVVEAKIVHESILAMRSIFINDLKKAVKI